MNDSPPTENPFRGHAPDPAELLMTVLGLTDTVIKIAEEASATHDEVRRVLKTLQAPVADVQKLGGELRGMYAPDHVRQAVAESKESIKGFRQQIAQLYTDHQVQVQASTALFWKRSAGALAVGVAFLAVLGFGLMYWVPSLDEVKARRAEMAVQPVKSVRFEGHQWVPVSEVQSLCDLDNKNCAQHGRID